MPLATRTNVGGRRVDGHWQGFVDRNIIVLLMKKLIASVFSSLLLFGAFGQSREALDGEHTLKERFELMKEKAESYNDYKVIKNYILDGVWKIHMDSIAQLKTDLQKANSTIAGLTGEIEKSAAMVKEAETTLADSEYERTHMSVFGIKVAKSVFVTSSLVILASLTVVLLTMLGTFKLLRRSNYEKELTIHSITSEFEEFRKKALEKEVKLSRELQSERNRAWEVRHEGR